MEKSAPKNRRFGNLELQNIAVDPLGVKYIKNNLLGLKRTKYQPSIKDSANAIQQHEVTNLKIFLK